MKGRYHQGGRGLAAEGHLTTTSPERGKGWSGAGKKEMKSGSWGRRVAAVQLGQNRKKGVVEFSDQEKDQNHHPRELKSGEKKKCGESGEKTWQEKNRKGLTMSGLGL